MPGGRLQPGRACRCGPAGPGPLGLPLRDTSLVRADLRQAVLCGADLTGARTEGLRLEQADLRGARIDTTGWTTAVCRGARVDIDQALAFAIGHGLDVG